MRKIKGFILGACALVLVGLGACDKPEINIGNPITGTWVLLETCIDLACVSPEPGTEITIEFRTNDLVERENGQVIGAADYQTISVNNANGVTTYQLVVNSQGWALEVRETSMELFSGISLRRYDRQ